VIYHVEQVSRRREDLWFFVCSVFCQNPSRIPQMEYLTLMYKPGDLRIDVQLHFYRQCQEGSDLSSADSH
jgi:hypothetical protein